MSIPVKRITEKFGKICDKTMEEDNKKKMICQQKIIFQLMQEFLLVIWLMNCVKLNCNL